MREINTGVILMLHRFSICVLLSIILINGIKPAFTASYQENVPEIYVYIDTTSDITVAKAEQFMGILKDRLAKSNQKIVFTSMQNPFQLEGQNTVGYIRFDPLFDAERIIRDYQVTISAMPKALKELSPILKNEVTPSISLDAPFAVDAAYAMILLSINRCDLALPTFQRLVLSKEEILDPVNYDLATCYLLEKDYQKSINLYRNFLYMDTPRFLGVNLAWLYIKTGQENAAFDLMRHAVEMAKNLDEGADEVLAARAQLFNLAFRYDDAVTDLTAAIDLSSNDPALYTLRGQTYLLLYEWDNVLADYNKALELDPTYADAYFYRGVLKYSVLQTGASLYADALADFQNYLELTPDGEHAADASRYATDIQTQLNALNN